MSRLVPTLAAALALAGAAVVPAAADHHEPALEAEVAVSEDEPVVGAEEVPRRWDLELPPYELNVKGNWWDPFNQNVLKGDYPVIGEDVFLKLTGISKTNLEGRTAPLPSAASAVRPGSFNFFGRNEAIIFDQKFALKLEMQQGSTAFKPFNWQFGLQGVFDLNVLDVYENAAVSPNVQEGTSRTTTHAALQEAFVEIHLADISRNYDFISAKVGRQPFNSDFRSLVFSDVNQGGRILGSANSNRYQYNLLYFEQAEKDTNSELNTFGLRDQGVGIANLYVQDFLFLGWMNQLSFHYLLDEGRDSDFVFDNQGFLVRPDPVGIARPHDIDAYYFGWTSEGHIGWLNISHAIYDVLGHDTSNPIAGRSVNIHGQMAFLELSIDRDWIRYQTSAFYSSGDDDPRDGTARGFDSILDRPQIMGGGFSYWNRQTIRITDRGGVALMGRESVIPDLRSSKIQGQPNFVNPGILMLNLGAVAEVTPKLRAIGNATYIRFVEPEPLRVLLKQPDVRRDVGVDVSLGLEYRPLLNNNIILKGFGAVLQPVGGFEDVFETNTLWQLGTEVVLIF